MSLCKKYMLTLMLPLGPEKLFLKRRSIKLVVMKHLGREVCQLKSESEAVSPETTVYCDVSMLHNFISENKLESHSDRTSCF